MPLITSEARKAVESQRKCGASSARLAKLSLPTSVFREAGGTAIGEAIRHLLQHSDQNREMKPETQLLLFEASRSQLVCEKVQPALPRGEFIVCHRFFDSTTVYEGRARALDSAVVKTLNDFAVANCIPDLAVLLDIDRGAARMRLGNRKLLDRMAEESEEFHNYVIAAYRDLARREPKRVVLLDRRALPDEVEIDVWKLVSAPFPRVAHDNSGSTIIHGFSSK